MRYELRRAANASSIRRWFVLTAASGGALLRSEVRRIESRVEERLATRSTREHGTGRLDEGDRPLTPHQRQLLEVLALIVIPKDESGPGANEANVVVTIEERLTHEPSRRAVYLRGLEGFDAEAKKRHGVSFEALTAPQQVELFQDAAQPKVTGIARLGGKAGRKMTRLYRVVRHPHAHLVPVLIQDVLEAFYTHPVSWEWLQYDGPPMPLGYPDVTQDRSLSLADGAADAGL
jgi:Gluconate 2-dehydrogenase subunit 3